MFSHILTPLSDVDLNVQNSNEVNSDGTTFGTLTIIIVSSILAISITIVWLVRVRRKRRPQRKENIEASEDDTDKQTDGGHSQYSSQTEVGDELRLGGTIPLLHSK